MSPRKLTPVAFNNVVLSDRFWAPKIEVNRTVTLPREYDLLETTGRIGALEMKWKKGDPNPPHIFWDSDTAKWIEAAAYSLSTTPDPALDNLLDEVIARIVKHQTKEGYFNSHYQVFERAKLGKRFTNLRDDHELYCAGHMFEAAVAHVRATGKRSLLDAMCKYADYLCTVFGTGEGQIRGYCGHEEIELALVSLYHATGAQRYLDLANYFVDERGHGAVGSKDPKPGVDNYFDVEAVARGQHAGQFHFARQLPPERRYEYNQAHKPVREQSVVTGHAVRAVYLYCAMADLANETGDMSLLAACERLWHSVVDERMYLTGAIGPSASNEGFTYAYDLPDETAYAETCASVGLVMWNHRMLQFGADGKYADVMERALYNGCLSGVSLGGDRFFYDNPLASAGHHHRQGWFDCACCPPNIARLIASVGGYFYSTSASGVWTHLYASGRAAIEAHGLMIEQRANYPWDGEASLTLTLDQTKSFALNLRVPGWCEGFTVKVNGKRVPGIARKGYVAVKRAWRSGDVVTLSLEMPARLMTASSKVRQTLGRVAIQRGPLVYCLEAADNKQAGHLDQLVIDPGAKFTTAVRNKLLGGVVVVTADAAVEAQDIGRALYAPASRAKRTAVKVTAIPYYAWDNRDPGEMRVWLRAVK